MKRSWMMAGVLGVPFAACGDPLLPSDYAGPPEATVTGTVFRPDPSQPVSVVEPFTKPLLTIEWLDGRVKPGQAGRTLIGQRVDYRRAHSIETDWELHLATPVEDARFTPAFDSQGVRVAVGKMVYFDDRVADDLLDWTCNTSRCDIVRSISAQFVVYVDRPPVCTEMATEHSVAPATSKISRGYHYFQYHATSGMVEERASHQPLSFHLVNLTPAQADLTEELRSFTQLLLARWNANPC